MTYETIEKKWLLKKLKFWQKTKMKMVLGGNIENKTCNVSTTCEDGTTIAIYDCKGLCSSQPREFVECIGQSQTLTKSYGGTGDGVQ